MLVCLIGVWCLCLHRPPRGLLFSCKNGRSHDARLIGLKADGRLESKKASSARQWSSGIPAWRCAVMAVQLCVAVDVQLVVFSWPLFCLCPSMWCRLFPGQAECVWKLLCWSLWLCYAGTFQGLGGVVAVTARLTPALIINVLCHSGDSSRLWRWDVLYW